MRKRCHACAQALLPGSILHGFASGATEHVTAWRCCARSAHEYFIHDLSAMRGRCRWHSRVTTHHEEATNTVRHYFQDATV